MPKISNHMIFTFNLKASIIKIFQFPFKFKVFCKQFSPIYLHPPHKIVGVPTNLSSKFLFKTLTILSPKIKPWHHFQQDYNPKWSFKSSKNVTPINWIVLMSSSDVNKLFKQFVYPRSFSQWINIVGPHT